VTRNLFERHIRPVFLGVSATGTRAVNAAEAIGMERH
jgi:hypothetical protein